MRDNKFQIMSFSSNFKLDSTFSRCSKTNKRTTAEKYSLASWRPFLRLVIDKLKLNVVGNFTPHKQFFVKTKIRRPLKPKMLTKSIVHWRKTDAIFNDRHLKSKWETFDSNSESFRP